MCKFDLKSKYKIDEKIQVIKRVRYRVKKIYIYVMCEFELQPKYKINEKI